MATLMEKIRDFFSGGSGKSGGSKSKSSGKGSKPTAKSTASSLATDVKMGLATFGQGKEEQAQTLRDLGYSEKSIQSYQERSAASLERAKAEQERISKDDNRSATTTDTSTDTDTTATTGTDTVLGQTTDTALNTVEDISKKTFTKTADFSPSVSVGKAEDEALEMMKKGRRATILTKPSGLLGAGTEEGKTRRRRLLIG